MKLSASSKSGGHWYGLDGEKRYGATLIQARKENLLPSPTEVLKVYSQGGGLDYWKAKKTAESGIQLERVEGESDDDYIKRVIRLSDELQSEGRTLGSKVHNGVENWLARKMWDESCPIMQRFDQWATDNIRAYEWSEQVLVNPKLGVAGTADALLYFKGKAADVCGGGPVLVDWKSQGMKLQTPKTKPAYYKPVFYDKWVMQLSFYQSCELVPPPVVSVAINTTEPEEPYLKLWTPEEVAEAFEAFKAALKLWQYEKNYKPNKEI